MKRKIKDVCEFRASTSAFRKEEEIALRLNIVTQLKPESIFDSQLSDGRILKPLNEFILETYTKSDILVYKGTVEDNLSTDQRLFLNKLKLMLINNDPNSEAPNCERYIDDFVTFLFYKAMLDNGLDLTLRPCNLKLKIHNNFFAAIADKEGRRGSELVWLLQEDKHRGTSTYKHGDIQISCAMIAAFQKNYYNLEKVYPDKIIGLKFMGEKVYFYSLSINEDYLEELEEGLPKSDVLIYKFPENGLDISSSADRRRIFEYISSLYYWAKSIK